MTAPWGAMSTDYIPKREDACAKCRQPSIICEFVESLCIGDRDIKHKYWLGRTKEAMDMLRRLPTEALKDYMSDQRRTPTELKAVILDELQQREKDEAMRL